MIEENEDVLGNTTPISVSNKLPGMEGYIRQCHPARSPELLEHYFKRVEQKIINFSMEMPM